jgi:excisionase family DNA binding protein
VDDSGAYTVQEAARILRTTERTVRRRLERGDLEGSRDPISGRWRVEARSVTEAMPERRDPEVGERVAKANHGPDHGIPSPVKKPLETAAYHAECLVSLAGIVDEQLTPKKRGRPRKAS